MCELTPPHLLQHLLTAVPQPPPWPCQITDLLAGRKVIVYGCGDGLITFSVFVLEKYNIRPEVILDTKFSKPSLVNAIPALSPIHYRPDPDICEEAIVVITVGKTRFHPEIIACLHQLGFKHIVLASDIYEYHLSHAPRGFEKLGHTFYQEQESAIRRAFALLVDDHSQEVFVQVLRTHVARMPVPIRHEALEDQYFPHDILLRKGVARMVNCGAYDGDTVRQLYAHHGKIESLICFEPDLVNFNRLCACLAGQAGILADSVMAFPCGVWSSEVQLRFSAGQRINSSVCEGGNVVIQCVALDHVIPDFCPTFINMDIEGAEPSALQGAAALIQRHQPDLAICVYHHPEHLWTIPNYLFSLVPEYQFYLRNYSGFPAETVLYATI